MRTNKKIASNLEKHILYISVGAKEHFYTLRKMVIDRSGSTWDDYICNLATSKEEAITKAQECFSKIKKHVGNQARPFQTIDSMILKMASPQLADTMDLRSVNCRIIMYSGWLISSQAER